MRFRNDVKNLMFDEPKLSTNYRINKSFFLSNKQKAISSTVSFKNKNKPNEKSDRSVTSFRSTNNVLNKINNQAIECLECNSIWKPCNTPIQINYLKSNKVKCAGSCYQYKNFYGSK